MSGRAPFVKKGAPPTKTGGRPNFFVVRASRLLALSDVTQDAGGTLAPQYARENLELRKSGRLGDRVAVCFLIS